MGRAFPGKTVWKDRRGTGRAMRMVNNAARSKAQGQLASAAVFCQVSGLCGSAKRALCAARSSPGFNSTACITTTERAFNSTVLLLSSPHALQTKGSQ